MVRSPGRKSGYEAWDPYIEGAPLPEVRELAAIAKARDLTMAAMARELNQDPSNFGRALGASRVGRTIRAFAKMLDFAPIEQRALFNELTARDAHTIENTIAYDVLRFCQNPNEAIRQIGNALDKMPSDQRHQVFREFLLAPHKAQKSSDGRGATDLSDLSRGLAALERKLRRQRHTIALRARIDVADMIEERERSATLALERFADEFHLDAVHQSQLVLQLKKWGRWPDSRIAEVEPLPWDEALAKFPEIQKSRKE